MTSAESGYFLRWLVIHGTTVPNTISNVPSWERENVVFISKNKFLFYLPVFITFVCYLKGCSWKSTCKIIIQSSKSSLHTIGMCEQIQYNYWNTNWVSDGSCINRQDCPLSVLNAVLEIRYSCNVSRYECMVCTCTVPCHVCYVIQCSCEMREGRGLTIIKIHILHVIYVLNYSIILFTIILILPIFFSLLTFNRKFRTRNRNNNVFGLHKQHVILKSHVRVCCQYNEILVSNRDIDIYHVSLYKFRWNSIASYSATSWWQMIVTTFFIFWWFKF